MTEENPLVSIIVITYNSAKYVLETLESAKAQTYQNIELIVSDDCSTDNTVEICRQWVEENKARFVRTELITNKNNTGIAPNCNRGLRAAKGTWVKLIAGDDALLPTLIEDYILYLKKNNHVRVIHSNVQKFRETFNDTNLVETTNLGSLKINKPETTTKEQYQILLRTGPIMTATTMIRMDVYEEVGLYDERSLFWEDTPMWLKITKAGIKIYFVDLVTAKYRVHAKSVQGNKKRNTLFSPFMISKDAYFRDHYLKELPFCERFLQGFLIWRNFYLLKFSKNKWSYFAMGLIVITNFLPYEILNHLIKKHLT